MNFIPADSRVLYFCRIWNALQKILISSICVLPSLRDLCSFPLLQDCYFCYIITVQEWLKDHAVWLYLQPQISFSLQRASPSPVTSPSFFSFLPSHSSWLQPHCISLGQLCYPPQWGKYPVGSYFMVLLKAEKVHFYSQAFLLVFCFLLLCVLPGCLSKLVP